VQTLINVFPDSVMSAHFWGKDDFFDSGDPLYILNPGILKFRIFSNYCTHLYKINIGLTIIFIYAYLINSLTKQHFKDI
ncbi:hypothetical protein ACE5SX_18015, partial [Lactiplantibacillus plantarum]|uniref:hypothetical protein n=1 Tax=Lactiplantibacillus plantarum TaxID=1590 RepID=UPI003C23B051